MSGSLLDANVLISLTDSAMHSTHSQRFRKPSSGLPPATGRPCWAGCPLRLYAWHRRLSQIVGHRKDRTRHLMQSRVSVTAPTAAGEDVSANPATLRGSLSRTRRRVQLAPSVRRRVCRACQALGPCPCRWSSRLPSRHSRVCADHGAGVFTCHRGDASHVHAVVARGGCAVAGAVLRGEVG